MTTAISETMMVPASIAPIEKSSGMMPSSLPTVQLTPVMNRNPLSLKIWAPRMNKKSPMSPSTTSEVRAPAVTTPRKILSSRL